VVGCLLPSTHLHIQRGRKRGNINRNNMRRCSSTQIKQDTQRKNGTKKQKKTFTCSAAAGLLCLSSCRGVKLSGVCCYLPTGPHSRLLQMKSRTMKSKADWPQRTIARGQDHCLQRSMSVAGLPLTPLLLCSDCSSSLSTKPRCCFQRRSCSSGNAAQVWRSY
jgi:hypothetical protein